MVAALFLLVDFDEIKRSVDEDLPKKYEWSAAFGLAFGVIWLFFKILELLGRDITHGTSAFRASVGASIAVCDVNWKDLF